MWGSPAAIKTGVGINEEGPMFAGAAEGKDAGVLTEVESWLKSSLSSMP